MQRIISLIPSATEIVCALGCEDRLVGDRRRSHNWNIYVMSENFVWRTKEVAGQSVRQLKILISRLPKET